MTPSRIPDDTFLDADGVRRRTILTGAAWTIPVIAVATASPAMAATDDLQLAFDKSSYTGEGCKTISGVKVTATRNGVAAPGESVTVTLADGYTFEDGSTSHTGTTGSDGAISLPSIKVPAQGGDSTFSASGGGASTSASVSSTASAATGLYVYNASTGDTTGPVANSSDAVRVISDPGANALVFQNSDGSIRGQGGSLQPETGSGVSTDARLLAIRTINGQNEVWYKKSDGLHVYNASTGKTDGPVKDSSDAIAIIASPTSNALVFQNSDGSIHGQDGTLQPGTASGVSTDAGLLAIRLINGENEVWYKKSDGLHVYNASTGKTTGPVANSSDAVRIISDPGANALVFQNSDGSIRGSGGTLQAETASGVSTDAGLLAIRTINGQNEVWYKKSDGLHVYNASTGKTDGPVKDSSDAIAIVASPTSSALVFQTSDGSIHGQSGAVQSKTSSGVSTGADLVAIRLINGANEVWYKKTPACS